MNFFLGFYKFGNKLYPILFNISILLCGLDLYMLFSNQFNNWTILAMILYSIFFIGIFIAYCYKLITKEIYFF